MIKLLLPSLAIGVSFAVMSVIASLSNMHGGKETPSTRMTTGTHARVLNRRYYDPRS